MFKRIISKILIGLGAPRIVCTGCNREFMCNPKCYGYEYTKEQANLFKEHGNCASLPLTILFHKHDGLLDEVLNK